MLKQIVLNYEWLFSHPEEPMQEGDEISQALALSLGNSDVPKDNANEEGRDISYEKKPLEIPTIEDILTTCMNLLQITYVISFFVTNLIVTFCN